MGSTSNRVNSLFGTQKLHGWGQNT
jgi:hypothetical protein